jgi:uncharacterized protein (TIGR03435 family)
MSRPYRGKAGSSGRLAALGVLVSVVAFCQDAPPRPKFEVASVKPVAPGSDQLPPEIRAKFDASIDTLRPRGSISRNGRRVVIRNETLLMLVCEAFRLRTREISGPAWMSEVRFDVDATFPADAPVTQANEMLQALLEERFGLEFHREDRQQQGYVLVVGKGGPKLTPADPNSNMSERLRARAMGGGGPMPAANASQPGKISNTVPNSSLENFADRLAGIVHRPVVDMTKIEGRYDILLEYPPAMDPTDPDPDRGVFSGVEELGLKLERRKVPVQVLVIDRVNKSPTPN